MNTRGNNDNRIDAFNAYRTRMNVRILEGEGAHLGIKRFFNLDSNAYRDGALTRPTKELLGLVASMVLRCDDCILYHLINVVEEGMSEEEIVEAMNVALVVGGSIVVPHLRRAYESLDELLKRRAG
ncbi:MAG TPA: carboxymuconolactone decarboxylase family protein [Rhodothermia bacterium]